MPVEKKVSLDGLAFGVIAVVSFLLPLFFIPSLSLDLAKNTLLQVGVVIAALLFFIARLRDGSISFPKSNILGAAGIVLLVVLISSIFSGAPFVSFFGFGNETGSFIAILSFVLLLVLSSIYFREPGKLFNFYTALLVSGVVLGLFQLMRLFFGPDFLSFGIFTGTTSSVFGKWNDMALFFGLTSILSLLALHFLTFRKNITYVIYGALALSLILLAVANFGMAWILVGLFSLVVFVYGLSLGRKVDETGKLHIPLLPLFLVIFSILFLLPGNFASSFLLEKFNISQIEVRPSWEATAGIAQTAIKADPVLGVGPNRFLSEWLLHKPASVNETIFWNTDFNFGVGYIPTFVVTTGILGILAWLLFIGTFLWAGWKKVLIERADALSRFLAISSFVGALYLWIIAIFYVPNVVLLSLAFIFTGAFVALLSRESSSEWQFAFSRDPRAGFVSVLVLILLIITSVIGAYFITQRTFSLYSFRQGVEALNVSGNVNEAENSIARAARLYPQDTYYRALSEVQIARLGSIISQSGINQEALRTEFQNGLGNAIASARAAVDYDPTYYLNWVSLGRVYEAVVPLGIEGAYDNAKASYNTAVSLNPVGPAMQVVLARNEVTREDLDEAKNYIARALEMKSNYTEAIFLLSQIEASEGNIRGAIQSAERASLVAPNDTGVFFQLGFLRYRNRDYQGAINALERAVSLNPVYANAKYFLGLSYDRTGRTADAIAQFEDIELLNPDNEEVKGILRNLRAGRDPLSNIGQEPPETRDEPPIEE